MAASRAASEEKIRLLGANPHPPYDRKSKNVDVERDFFMHPVTLMHLYGLFRWLVGPLVRPLVGWSVTNERFC